MGLPFANHGWGRYVRRSDTNQGFKSNIFYSLPLLSISPRFPGVGGCGLVGRARVGNSVRPNLQILKFGRSGIYTVAQLTCGLLGTTQGFDHGFLLVSIRRLPPYVPSAAVRSIMLSQAMMQLSEGYPASTQPPEYGTPNKREATTAGMGIELKCRTAWIKAVTLSGQDLARGRAEPGLSLALRRRLWPSVR